MKRTLPAPKQRYLVVALPIVSRALLRRLTWVFGLMLLSNLISHSWRGWGSSTAAAPIVPETKTTLFLLDKASRSIPNPQGFAEKVYTIANRLKLAPEWLMAVMDAESGFDPHVYNHRGSGAVGLIQFMPQTAQELGTSSEALRHMDALTQLDVVEAYFAQSLRRYGPFRNLTDLYIAVLYPKARQQGPCFTLYARPSQSYRQNSGLDENQDGRVTVYDIEQRMQRMFPHAYAISSI